MSNRQGKGFTLVEMLVVIAIIVLLVGIIVPTLSQARENARREACRSTLHGLGQAAHSYMTTYNNYLPTFADGSNSSDTVGLNRTQENPGDSRSNTRGWWLVVREGYCQREQFICPSDDDVATDMDFVPEDIYDFPTKAGSAPLSYSLQRTKIGPTGNGVRATRADDSELVYAADFNGLTKWSNLLGNKAVATRDGDVPLDDDQPAKANSVNHGREGQNCLRLNGSVTWAQTPLAGVDKDCIYTRDDGSTMGEYSLDSGPSLDRGKLTDSFLIP
jgi:prepilin-type N-terminal cleavage/methylation domain-containing protein